MPSLGTPNGESLFEVVSQCSFYPLLQGMRRATRIEGGNKVKRFVLEANESHTICSDEKVFFWKLHSAWARLGFVVMVRWRRQLTQNDTTCGGRTLSKIHFTNVWVNEIQAFWEQLILAPSDFQQPVFTRCALRRRDFQVYTSEMQVMTFKCNCNSVFLYCIRSCLLNLRREVKFMTIWHTYFAWNTRLARTIT